MSRQAEYDAGLVIAMFSEARHLLDAADFREEIADRPYRTWLCRFDSASVAVLQSGIGMVQAAAGTQFLISSYRPEIIGNFGCAGAHRQDLNPGDVVVGDRCVAHYNMQILPDGTERYVGFTTEEGSDIAHAGDQDGVHSDQTLVRKAIAAAKVTGVESWPGSTTPGTVHVGAVGSADIWTQQASRLRALHQQHGTLCEDMEAAAIARIAGNQGVPFFTVKDISNNELQASTDLTDFSDFPVVEVGKRAARVVEQLLRDLR